MILVTRSTEDDAPVYVIRKLVSGGAILGIPGYPELDPEGVWSMGIGIYPATEMQINKAIYRELQQLKARRVVVPFKKARNATP